MAIEALYRTIRSDARQLARRDSLAVIWAYSQFLQVNDFQMPQYIEVAQRERKFEHSIVASDVSASSQSTSTAERK